MTDRWGASRRSKPRYEYIASIEEYESLQDARPTERDHIAIRASAKADHIHDRKWIALCESCFLDSPGCEYVSGDCLIEVCKAVKGRPAAAARIAGEILAGDPDYEQDDTEKLNEFRRLI